MSNGAFSIYKIFIGAGVSATLGILTFMGNGIVNNDKENTNQHIIMRGERAFGDLAVTEKIDKVEDIVTDIRLEQTEQRVLLQGIAGKL